MHESLIDRRAILRGAAYGGAALGLSGLFPAWAQSGSAGIPSALPTLSGEDINLTIGHSSFAVAAVSYTHLTLPTKRIV